MSAKPSFHPALIASEKQWARVVSALESRGAAADMQTANALRKQLQSQSRRWKRGAMSSETSK